ncbi:hypothetical protein AG1IA_01843 [Rhizoctonia solani AG-1 IA]|uniref:Uncharacterized protein n=1 Tax=Thanatephorus cucumeris (strain AG1-IA) TaxID=983506 RepID=L8X513_THACA|nr:hypothetical protein AG1IA_01843 [Rhizoctonia solani AG-1 IA]
MRLVGFEKMLLTLFFEYDYTHTFHLFRHLPIFFLPPSAREGDDICRIVVDSVLCLVQFQNVSCLCSLSFSRRGGDNYLGLKRIADLFFELTAFRCHPRPARGHNEDLFIGTV